MEVSCPEILKAGTRWTLRHSEIKYDHILPQASCFSLVRALTMFRATFKSQNLRFL